MRQILFGLILFFIWVDVSLAFSKPPCKNSTNHHHYQRCQLNPKPVPEIDAQVAPMVGAIVLIGLLIFKERSSKKS